MPLSILKHFFTKHTYCVRLCFHLPIETTCWYSEASDQLSQEWEFFHQVCTAEAPDDLCASHRSYLTTNPSWIETRGEFWRYIAAQIVLRPLSLCKAFITWLRQRPRDFPWGRGLYTLTLTSAFCAGRSVFRRNLYTLTSLSRAGRSDFRRSHSLYTLSSVFGAFPLDK